MMPGFDNPVDVRFGCGRLGELGSLLGGRSYALVTYDAPLFERIRETVSAAVGRPIVVIDDVAPNPDLSRLAEQTRRFGELSTTPEVIIAIGGGSVIDSAKVLAAANSDFANVQRALRSKRGEAGCACIPIVAVPTTAGTGSEVTCWATIWDVAAGTKHSLALQGLYPRHAIVDPELMLSQPRSLTINTGLDALSHALESLWNRSANEVSMGCAVLAAREILEALPQLVDHLDDLTLRTRMARAALRAGLAFSNTRTAVAHQLSYSMTLNKAVPHGIACSFTLPMVMRSVATVQGICNEALREIFGVSPQAGADRLTRWLNDLGVATTPAAYGLDEREWLAMIDGALLGERGRNFIGTREALLRAT